MYRLSAKIALIVAAVVLAAAGNAFPAPQAPAIRLVLPDTIYAVPGIETNVYFDNVTLVLNPVNHSFDVVCPKGRQQAERWNFVPTDKDVGKYPFALDIRDAANQLVAHGESTLVVAPADAGAGGSVSALLIGDSLTHAAVYSQRLLDLFARPGEATFALVGSHAPKEDAPANRHEGYGGWTARRFATHYTGKARTGSYKDRGSPFLYKEGDAPPRLDYTRYCGDVNDGGIPNYVTIFLGCNDTFGASDETIEAAIDDMFAHMDALIAMIRAAAPETVIGLLEPVPPAGTQDAFAANYGCGQTRWQYKRNQHRVLERMTECYGKRQAENISLVPAYVNLDCLRNFPQTTGPWNAHTEREVARLNNGVHPAPEGYDQIGDSIYCWMKAQLTNP